MSLRIGILGAARVAVYAMIAAAKDVENVEVSAVASRDPERAKAYAETHGIPLTFDSYEAMIASDDVDAIYNALPPNLHARWSIAALEAGKPVLCEKPFALNVADVEAMLAAEARTGLFLMEAQHTYYHPRHARIREIVQGREIGNIRHISARFDVPIPETADELRWDGAVGGGALWDLGVYPLFWLRAAMGEEPCLISASHRLNDRGADIETEAVFDFASGATGSITCSMERKFAAWLNVEGEAGSLFVDNPLSPAEQKITLEKSGAATEELFTGRPSYSFQLEAFRDAVTGGRSVYTRGADSLKTIQILSDIRALAMER
ncbi:MAG: Gfo/Idh/MocA family oxidoreductase [Sphingomonadaceae bacterium]|nr:Gfo/Idh/MocA family oxidoreductase [Sphingomonadaceae bacterium]